MRRLRVRDAFGDLTLSQALVDEVLEAFDLYFRQGWRLFDDTLATLNSQDGKGRRGWRRRL